jgi:hypothetical protein
MPKAKTQDEQDDDEIMQKAYRNLEIAFGLRRPTDPLKLKGWWKAYELNKQAKIALETPYRDAVTILGRIAP